MKTKTYKKFLSLLLAVMLTLSMLPMSVFAFDEPSQDPSGAYLIGTAEELKWFADYVNSDGEGRASANAKLTADIDLSTICSETLGSWTPIGSRASYAYKGVFDGDGHEITGLYINNSSANYQGLFGYVNGGTVKNLGVRGSVTGGQYVGGIVASLKASGTIENCFSEVTVTAKGRAGGIVGNLASGTVKSCYNLGNITTTSALATGGIAGTITESEAHITNCYSVGTVSSVDGATVGGIHAYEKTSPSVASNCYYLAGSVKVGDAAYVDTDFAKTSDELKGLAETLGSSFKADAGSINGGYPVLSWQKSEYIPETVDVTGVALDTATAELKVGKSQTLTATVSPEDATDKSVTWSSDNEEVATVDENGLVTAVGAGVANITVKTVDGEFTDVCKVTVKEPEGYLSAVKFRTSNGSTAPYLELVPEFDAKKYDYTVIIPDNGSANGVYITAVLSSAAPEGSTASVEYFNEYASANKTVNGITKETKLPYAANPGVVMTVKAGTEEDNQTYTVKVMHSPTVSGISLADENGNAVNMNETFKAATTEYTATTAADKITVNAVPYNEEYTVTYNGSESGEVELVKGENVVNVVVKNDDGLEKIYTVKITKVDSIFVSFSVNPADAVILLKDSFGERLWPDENGRYSIMAGAEYSYIVTRSGYIANGNSFTSSKNMLISVNLEKAAESSFKNLSAYWPNFRNGENHLGINTSKTPYAPEDAELLWAVKYGSGWSAAPGSPIIVDDCIVTYVGSTIKKINKDTGAVIAEGQMVGSSSFSIVPPTYADGMIFVGLSGGRIQAFNAETLESIWVYTDDLGGQPNCPITYKDGYVYAGFWNSEIKGANFACVSVTDEDPNETTEAKEASWTYTRVGGFYWAGAYASDKFVVVGTDDGLSGYNSESASLLVFDRITGELVDSYDGIRGDIRSNVSYDPTSDRVFFSSKGGVLCNAKIDWETGEIKEFNSTVITDSKGNEYAMSTCTPSVYNGRIYIGVSGKSQFGAFSGHAINVYDLNSDGSMTLAYSYDIMGYPQTSAMVTTAYEAEDGYVYIYLPYNYEPGGISVLKDKPGQTEPITTTDAGYSEVFTPVGPLAQYCICSAIADEYGTIYYKNDSCYLMAITSKIESIEVIQKGTLTDENGSVSGDGFVVVANLKNGMSRDISSEVEFSKEGDAYVVSYTYGFDNANYGLKTLKTCVEGHSYGEDNVCDICGHVNYEVIEGADSTWKKNSTDPVSMTANGAYADFRAVRVDGNELDAGDYEVSETGNGTKVVFKVNYLGTLGEGAHNIEIVFSDGKATTSMTVENVKVPSDAGHSDTTTIVIGGNTASESEYNPNTGAELPLNAVALAGLCAAALVAVRKH
ncbi:MAG: Ig-like domain-containing protein [Oscillospiraceae bacterium]